MRNTKIVMPLGGLLFFPFALIPQEIHDHGAPEKLGAVSFPISCIEGVQQDFDKGIALLHSFAYGAAETAFRAVEEHDPHCAMAHWGIAMTHFHQLWEPRLPASTIPAGKEEIRRAQALGGGSERERRFIDALALIYQSDPGVPYSVRASRYERAMCDLAASNREDPEEQVFCALALLSNASPLDKSHTKQKRAAGILEPLSAVYPQHPGISHYLIHAYDNAELASRGLITARAYAKIAPSAPHALHMPSHIFTRLGRWDDSIASNIAARRAAHQQGDLGEELHAMDYLVYAYLQSGRYSEAAQLLNELGAMPKLDFSDFKVGYAATAMPIRYAVERKRWAEAAMIQPPKGAPPHVLAIAVWARGLGLARSARITEAHAAAESLRPLEQQLRTSGNDYWAAQVRILTREIAAWIAQAANQPGEAQALMRAAADDEDSVEKLPVTPGPILPAREQLGYLLLQQHRPCAAAKEFQASLALAPGRHGAIAGASQAAGLCGRDKEAPASFREPLAATTVARFELIAF
jgi:tetratricopeptide (TPR) repeat protein